ncbi:hypothetical protein L1049_008393 [Liquidambar formosana]|uniref:Uncharacterized protein n=1 Tax=Liquidambar formosana TaxID=63359 RepID=A0AAP0S2Y9_LIQFO
METHSVILSGSFDGQDDGVSGLVHLASLKFLTLRPFIGVTLSKDVPSLKLRVEILESAFDACESLLDNARQVWKKSMMSVMAWLCPEAMTSEAKYGVSDSTEMELDLDMEMGTNSSFISKKHARFDVARFYEAIKPSKGNPMLEDDIPGLLPNLRPYQRRAAYWMVQRDKGAPGSLVETKRSSPLCVPVDFVDTCSRMFYNPFRSSVALEATKEIWMVGNLDVDFGSSTGENHRVRSDRSSCHIDGDDARRKIDQRLPLRDCRRCQFKDGEVLRSSGSSMMVSTKSSMSILRTLKVGAEDDKKVTVGMPSFVPPIPNSNSIGTEGNTIRSSRISDFGVLEQSLGFHIEDAVDLTRNPIFNSIKSSSQAVGTDIQFGTLNKSLASSDINLSAAIVGTQTLPLQKELQPNLASVSGGHRENWAESNMADGSPRTDTSTDVDTDDKNQRFEMGQSNALVASDSSDRSKEKSGDQKTLRRLAQNREAARKSRLRKKAYVQQLESSRLKLTQLEQELQRARQQGIFISSSGDQSHSMSGNGALAFDVEYARWLEEQNRHINELRAAVNSHAGDTELRTIVDNVSAHFDDIFRLKGIAAKADVFHILSGMWKTPAERCFMWIGGFRSSELLKLLISQLEPLTEQQLMNIYNLQQSSQQAEDALSQGMEALQQSLADTLANGSPGPSGSSGNVANYMGQMAMAMGKLGTLEGFLRQADNLRQQTLQQMHRILTTRQSARALLAINDYFSRLRALSSLWLARPRE